MEKVFPRRRHREGTEEDAPKRTPQSSRRRRNIMAWYDSAVFYHIYPLGLCGCARENKGEPEEHFDQLTAWADHARDLECTAIYIGPLFESEGHGYETRDYRMVDRRLGTNEDFKKWVAHCHEIGLKVIVERRVQPHRAAASSPFQEPMNGKPGKLPLQGLVLQS